MRRARSACCATFHQVRSCLGPCRRHRRRGPSSLTCSVPRPPIPSIVRHRPTLPYRHCRGCRSLSVPEMQMRALLKALPRARGGVPGWEMVRWDSKSRSRRVMSWQVRCCGLAGCVPPELGPDRHEMGRGRFCGGPCLPYIRIQLRYFAADHDDSREWFPSVYLSSLSSWSYTVTVTVVLDHWCVDTASRGANAHHFSGFRSVKPV